MNQYILSEMQIKTLMVLMNRDCGMDLDEFVKIGKELRSHPYNPQTLPSSEPSWVTIYDGSDRDYRLISMYELKELGYAINEDEPGHLKELHDSGNKVIDKVRSRQYNPQAEREKVLDDVVKILNNGMDALEELQVDGYSSTTITAKRDVIGYLLEKIAELREGKDGE